MGIATSSHSSRWDEVWVLRISLGSNWTVYVGCTGDAAEIVVIFICTKPIKNATNLTAGAIKKHYEKPVNDPEEYTGSSFGETVLQIVHDQSEEKSIIRIGSFFSPGGGWNASCTSKTHQTVMFITTQIKNFLSSPAPPLRGSSPFAAVYWCTSDGGFHKRKQIVCLCPADRWTVG